MEAQDLRRRVWDEMLFAAMRSNYFGGMVLWYRNLEKWIRVVILLASSGAAAAVLANAPEWIKLGLPLLAAAGTFWLILSQFGTLAHDAADLHSGWNSVQARYERLWNHLEGGSEATFHEIFDSANALSKAGTKFPNKQRRLALCLDQVSEIAVARYA
jgi:hypothetical protein